MEGGNRSVQYQKIDARSVKSWRIGGLIGFTVVACICIPVASLIASSEIAPLWQYLSGAVMIIAVCFSIADIFIFPVIEYRQWGYILEDDRVVIRHGIFFVKETVIPIIRIQNITISQGPINRKLGLCEIRISLASGVFSIKGLDRQTADTISEKLKKQLYQRVSEKGVLS